MGRYVFGGKNTYRLLSENLKVTTRPTKYTKYTKKRVKKILLSCFFVCFVSSIVLD